MDDLSFNVEQYLKNKLIQCIMSSDQRYENNLDHLKNLSLDDLKNIEKNCTYGVRPE